MADLPNLYVLIAGKIAGKLWRDDSKGICFRYLDGYSSTPLSLSMPVTNRIYTEKTVRPYLFGLLPDDSRTRTSIAREFEVKASDPLALLAHIGLDCPGAVQVCPEDALENTTGRHGRYEPLDDAAIAKRLRALRATPNDSWLGYDEHWSLGGNQGKFALALVDKTWCECKGSAASTHIFKNGIAEYRLQALNEFVCVRLAKACGLPCSDVEYRLFEDEPAIMVKRYDRVVGADGSVRRLHQEDVCQAMGVMPEQKYTSDGGPSASDVLALLLRTKLPRVNVELFSRMLFFNCLIGAPDAHAKNYSLLLSTGGQALVAPLYDVASGLAYDTLRRKGRLAMSIGGENRFGRMSPSALEQYAANGHLDEAGLNSEWCIKTTVSLAKNIQDALSNVFDSISSVPNIDELRNHLENPIKENCRSISAQLGA